MFKNISMKKYDTIIEILYWLLLIIIILILALIFFIMYIG